MMASRKPPTKHTSGLVGVAVEHAAYRSFSQFAQTEAWTPAVNIYQIGKRLHVCVDLAGIERDQIDVRIEPGRLSITGIRHAPEPTQQQGGSSVSDIDMKILSMEIDHGTFRREIPVPRTVNLDQVESEYRSGILWITLPLK